MSGAGSDPRRICLVGATGLVGRSVIEAAMDQPDVRVIGVARREMPLPPGARMEMLVAPTSGWRDAIEAAGASVLVCALGTTWKNAGRDEAAFRAVDFDLPLACAHAAKEVGIGHFILVSSSGADAASKNRYVRTKGEIEQAIERLRFRRLDILRPGLLRGHRDESRPAEQLAMLASPLLDLLLHGGLRRYRSIRASQVARAILALSREKAAGHFIHDRDSMLRAIRRAGG